MTRVCLVAEDDVSFPFDLLAYETARDALSTYDLREPWTDAVAVDTVSIGAAVSLLNDLDWYLSRLVKEAMVLEPSVSDLEWLSRALAVEVREGHVEADEPTNRLRVYGVDDDGRLVDPTTVLRGDVPEGEYERVEYDECVVIRLTPEEFH